MDTDIIKSDWYLLMMVSLTGLKLIFHLHTLKKQAQRNRITKENLDTSPAVKTLVLLDRYVSEILQNFKRKYYKR